MQISQATLIAKTIKAQLEYFCLPNMCAIAGSVRRELPEVGDIELVVVPKKQVYEQASLFDEMPDNSIQAPCREFIVTANSLGKIIKGTPHGRYMQFELVEKINLDLFITEEKEFGRILAIRTGSSNYSHKVIAGGWRARGWVGTDKGLRLQKQCYPIDIGNDKKKWICNADHPTLPPPFLTEQDFFDFIKVDFIKPQDRK